MTPINFMLGEIYVSGGAIAITLAVMVVWAVGDSIVKQHKKPKAKKEPTEK